MKKNDPYEALRYKEFKFFLMMRFAMVFAWSMQFVIIEWEVYSLTKDPLSLGIIGLMEIIPAVAMSLFAGHIVEQKENRHSKFGSLFSFIVATTRFGNECCIQDDNRSPHCPKNSSPNQTQPSPTRPTSTPID